ncbi:MAG: hypothetical protein ACYDIC_07985 [Desulfobaccales bacterium]
MNSTIGARAPGGRKASVSALLKDLTREDQDMVRPRWPRPSASNRPLAV